MGRLEEKRMLVTGAATGIGRATAVRVASEGARVAMFDIKDSNAADTLATIEDGGGEARYWHVDVTWPACSTARASTSPSSTTTSGTR